MRMTFKALAVWQRSARVSASFYKALAELKNYGLRDQITRSGLSISSKMAEGYGLGLGKELMQFLRYVKGSAAELETHIWTGTEIGYIERAPGKLWAQEASEIQAMLDGLINSKN